MSACYNLNGMHSMICTYIRRYYYSAMSRHVQTCELVLYMYEYRLCNGVGQV